MFYLSTNAKGCNATAIWRAYKRGAAFANPCYTQIHPTCIPVSGEYQSKLTLMSESLRNDGRVWVPKRKEDVRQGAERDSRGRIATTTSSGSIRASATSRRATSRRARRRKCATKGAASGPGGRGVYLDFADAIKRLGEDRIRERYGNLFEMYERITDENPYEVPMRIYPAVHYTMGGLWVDYNLMSTIPGPARRRRSELLRSRREPARRERADAGPRRRLLRRCRTRSATTSASNKLEPVSADAPGGEGGRRRRRERTKRLLGVQGQAHRRDRSTASSARSCGSTAAWRATPTGCGRRSS